MAMQAVGMTLMGWLTPETALVCAFIQGCSGGIMQNVTAVAYANFFGRKHLGAIQGFAQSAGVLGASVPATALRAFRARASARSRVRATAAARARAAAAAAAAAPAPAPAADAAAELSLADSAGAVCPQGARSARCRLVSSTTSPARTSLPGLRAAPSRPSTPSSAGISWRHLSRRSRRCARQQPPTLVICLERQPCLVCRGEFALTVREGVCPSFVEVFLVSC